MTLSREQRHAQLERALNLLLLLLNGRAIDCGEIDPRDPTLVELQPTTWKELEELHFVARDTEAEPPAYRLTGDGWIEALAVSRQYEDEALAEKLGRLAAYLKKTVKGRRRPAVAPLRTIAAE